MKDEVIAPDLFLNNHLLEHIKQRKELVRNDLSAVFAWYRPCHVKVLLVTDGGLSFGMDDFGLSAFIDCLQNDGRNYVKFDITLAHLRSNANAAEMGGAIPGIVNRITNFRFDNPAHFTPSMYDQVWLFGIETNFHRPDYAHRNANRPTYPSNRLSNTELINLSTFMQNGGGIFATGDHGSLGNSLCGSIARVRNMRLWGPNIVAGQDEVSMDGPRRNDTNQVGDPGTQFNDQSDDIPQSILPKYYFSFLKKYPHPLLCCKYGVISVLPDHPHEGECIVPPNLGLTYTYDGSVEYPDDSAGNQVVPEIIATSQVRSGNTADISGISPYKSPTQAHNFGAICAYDGHRAGIGRVVTDATWHHFVNVNLIGVFNDALVPGDPIKQNGFLSTPAGMAHMARIKEYYVNIGVWISPPSRISCFNRHFWWKIIYSDRVMEASMSNPDTPMTRISPQLYYSIGVHARDVLGRSASQCQSWAFLVDFSQLVARELMPIIDPWGPKKEIRDEEERLLPDFDPSPLLDIALGAAIVSLRQEHPYPPEKMDEKFIKSADKAILSGAQMGLDLAYKHYSNALKSFSGLLNTCKKTSKDK